MVERVTASHLSLRRSPSQPLTLQAGSGKYANNLNKIVHTSTHDESYIFKVFKLGQINKNT